MCFLILVIYCIGQEKLTEHCYCSQRFGFGLHFEPECSHSHYLLFLERLGSLQRSHQDSSNE